MKNPIKTVRDWIDGPVDDPFGYENQAIRAQHEAEQKQAAEQELRSSDEVREVIANLRAQNGGRLPQPRHSDTKHELTVHVRTEDVERVQDVMAAVSRALTDAGIRALVTWPGNAMEQESPERVEAKAEELLEAYFDAEDLANTPTSHLSWYGDDGATDEFLDVDTEPAANALNEYLLAHPELAKAEKWSGMYNDAVKNRDGGLEL